MNATVDYSILITDDDPACRAALRDVLEPAGYRTLQAQSGEEAVDIVRELPVHALLLDMNMPRLTGLETVELIHQMNAQLPCILVTAEADPGLMRRAFQAQVYSVIPKPVSKSVLLYTVLKALARFYGQG